mmetsp:Transcript_123290/g.343317  ORF Transcript_123290/g.343317 Transcript_123290/m.343317 type:complete len:202 (-) Transcript_123290:2309-2914(-)
MRRFISLANHLSLNLVSVAPSRSGWLPSSMAFIVSRNTGNARSALFATVSSKLADSRVSPELAIARRTVSAEYFFMMSSSVKKLPLDLDIFSLLTRSQPLQKNPRGHSSGSFSQTHAWLYSAMVRWFWMRSLPETRRSIGYQNLNSRCIFSRVALGIFESKGSGPFRNRKSHTASVRSDALMAPSPSLEPSKLLWRKCATV